MMVIEVVVVVVVIGVGVHVVGCGAWHSLSFHLSRSLSCCSNNEFSSTKMWNTRNYRASNSAIFPAR